VPACGRTATEKETRLEGGFPQLILFGGMLDYVLEEKKQKRSMVA
jgi:hypothetical protein